MTRWLHKTSKLKAASIMKEGFKLPKENGRFGKGVYFMNSLEFGFFGDTTISVKVDCPIITLTHGEICEIYSGYNLEPEEEGIVELEGYVKEKGFHVVEVKYRDGTSELVLYNTEYVSDMRLLV